MRQAGVFSTSTSAHLVSLNQPRVYSWMGFTIVLALFLPAQAARVRCSDFSTQEQVIAAYNAGATYLDRDGDGYACETTLNAYVLGKTATPEFAPVPRPSLKPSLPPPIPNTSTNVHLALGNPSQARTHPDNYLIVKPQYVLSYNSAKGIPNWVSWQLNSSWLGRVERQNDFRPDPALPQGLRVISQVDYTASGYDRGHQCPSADRTADQGANSATFLMSNIIPQTPDLNRGPWEKLESYSRKLVAQGKELYIIAGVAGVQGMIGKGKITIPTRNWKVVVILDQPGLGLAGVTSATRILAVNMPNDKGIKNKGWGQYVTTVDEIERLTGYDLLSKVPTNIQVVIENRPFIIKNSN